MLGFLLGYLLGSPSYTIRQVEKEKPLTKAQLKALAARRKHDLTCPNLPKDNGNHSEMDSIFY